jgi:hypothetical protein
VATAPRVAASRGRGGAGQGRWWAAGRPGGLRRAPPTCLRPAAAAADAQLVHGVQHARRAVLVRRREAQVVVGAQVEAAARGARQLQRHVVHAAAIDRGCSRGAVRAGLAPRGAGRRARSRGRRRRARPGPAAGQPAATAGSRRAEPASSSCAAHVLSSTLCRSMTSIQASGALQMGRFQQSCARCVASSWAWQPGGGRAGAARGGVGLLLRDGLTHMDAHVEAPVVKVLAGLADGRVALQPLGGGGA